MSRTLTDMLVKTVERDGKNWDTIYPQNLQSGLCTCMSISSLSVVHGIVEEGSRAKTSCVYLRTCISGMCKHEYQASRHPDDSSKE